MSRGTCSDCGRPILWARTIPGQAMIALDPDPRADDDEAANYERVPRPSGDYVRALTADEPHIVGARRYVPHVATCPERRPAPPDPEPETPWWDR